MAAGNTYWFASYFERVFDFQSANFNTPNSIYVALIKSAANGGFDPAVTTAWPTWGSAGTNDLSAAEVTAGGNYSAGGVAVASPASTLNSNVLELDWGNPATWAQDASNPTNARWAIFYDFTNANKDCICYYDLGADLDMTTGDLSITMGAPALTITCAT